MALALIPMIRTKREVRKLIEKTETLERMIERLQLEKDVYNPANHSEPPIDKADFAETSGQYTQ